MRSRFTSDPTTGDPAKPPVPAPIERTYPSATGSGEHLPTVGRIPTVDGHQSQVIGTYARTVDDDDTVTYAPTSGTPTGWSTGLPDATALPRTQTKVTRSRKGRSSFRPIGPRPMFKVTGGVTDYVDPIADMAANLVACLEPSEHAARCRCGLTESRLTAVATTMLECHADDVLRDVNGRQIPSTVKLIGDRPQTIPGDRSSLGIVQGGERSAMGAVIVSNGDLGSFFGIDGMGNEFASGASKRGMTESSLTWPTRDTVAPRNRLHSKTQLAKASVSLIGTVRVSGRNGEHAELVKQGTTGRGVSRIIGRRITRPMSYTRGVSSYPAGPIDALVSFSDDGWFIGHEHTVVASKPTAARVARLAERLAERDNIRAALRAETMATSEPIGRQGTPSAESTVRAEAAPSSPLQTIRAMALGETLHGLTRTHPSRWTDGATTYSSHATAAIALSKLAATV